MDKAKVDNKAEKAKVDKTELSLEISTKVVTVVGTGTHKGIPKDSEHEVSESNANALIHAGRAKLKTK